MLLSISCTFLYLVMTLQGLLCVGFCELFMLFEIRFLQVFVSYEYSGRRDTRVRANGNRRSGDKETATE